MLLWGRKLGFIAIRSDVLVRKYHRRDVIQGSILKCENSVIVVSHWLWFMNLSSDKAEKIYHLYHHCPPGLFGPHRWQRYCLCIAAFIVDNNIVQSGHHQRHQCHYHPHLRHHYSYHPHLRGQQSVWSMPWRSSMSTAVDSDWSRASSPAYSGWLKYVIMHHLQ